MGRNRETLCAQGRFPGPPRGGEGRVRGGPGARSAFQHHGQDLRRAADSRGGPARRAQEQQVTLSRPTAGATPEPARPWKPAASSRLGRLLRARRGVCAHSRASGPRNCSWRPFGRTPPSPRLGRHCRSPHSPRESAPRVTCCSRAQESPGKSRTRRRLTAHARAQKKDSKRKQKKKNKEKKNPGRGPGGSRWTVIIHARPRGPSGFQRDDQHCPPTPPPRTPVWKRLRGPGRSSTQRGLEGLPGLLAQRTLHGPLRAPRGEGPRRCGAGALGRWVSGGVGRAQADPPHSQTSPVPNDRTAAQRPPFSAAVRGPPPRTRASGCRSAPRRQRAGSPARGGGARSAGPAGSGLGLGGHLTRPAGAPGSQHRGAQAKQDPANTPRPARLGRQTRCEAVGTTADPDSPAARRAFPLISCAGCALPAPRPHPPPPPLARPGPQRSVGWAGAPVLSAPLPGALSSPNLPRSFLRRGMPRSRGPQLCAATLHGILARCTHSPVEALQAAAPSDTPTPATRPAPGSHPRALFQGWKEIPLGGGTGAGGGKGGRQGAPSAARSQNGSHRSLRPPALGTREGEKARAVSWETTVHARKRNLSN